MAQVNIVCGGTSSERDVSLRSGAAVARALSAAGYDIRVLDLATADISEIINCDVVFPALHGAGGEDGTFQTLLEERGVQYVGSDSKASKLCFDKWAFRQAAAKAGLPIAKGALVAQSEHRDHELAQDLHVLKPITGGSSIDTFIVRDLSTIPHEAIDQTFERYPTMLLEELIEGVELTVGILGTTPLPIIEIIPPENAEFDYENKYNGLTQEIVAPKSISPEIQTAAQKLALAAHQLAGCRDFSRSDIMVDQAGKLYLLETNTIPGLTDQSLFPKMAANAGITMPDLCKQLIEMALRR